MPLPPLPPRVPLGVVPTPIRSLEALRPGLFLKDDGLCAPAYGGNKARKLEFLLAEAGPRVLTVGAVGSHHVLATAVHGERLGVEVEAVALPRPWSAHTGQTLQATLPRCRLHVVGSMDEARAALKQAGPGRAVIPAGGSSWRGTLGYVLAAFELAEQVREGALPEPRRVYVPLGTGGTAVGLAMGLRAAGLRSEVVAVRVVPESWLDARRLRRLAEEVGARTGLAPALPRVHEDGLGPGYGWPTPGALDAMARAEAADLFVEPTYTAKALARALVDEGGPDLFWLTLNRQPLAPLLGPPLDRAAWPFLPEAAP